MDKSHPIPLKTQHKMVEFFLKTSVPRLLKERERVEQMEKEQKKDE